MEKDSIVKDNKTKWLSIHICVRNDFGPRSNTIQFFHSEEAISNVIEEMNDRLSLMNDWKPMKNEFKSVNF